MGKNKKELGHIGYKISAVLLAIVAWLAVANISDYQTTRQISNIPVTQINGDVLDELDQVYDVVSGDTVDIIVKGRRSVVGTLDKDDFTAIADLSTMSITDTVSISVEAKSNTVQSEINITCVDNTMKLNLEEKVTQQFPIKVVTTGSTKNGYAVSGTSSTPNIYDAYGEEITNDKITLDVASAKVSVEIYATKSVPIEVNLRGTPGDGYGVEGVVYQPQSVELVGPADALAKIETVDVDDVSVSGMTEDYQTDVDIRDYLPDGVSVVDIPPEITVNISITKLEDKKLTVTVNSFVLDKQVDGYQYEVTINNFTITASGFADVVSKLTLDDVVPTIDCSGLPVGNHGNVTVTLKEIDGVTYTMSGTVSVNVTNAENK